MAGIPTPLGTATGYHLYNQTRSKLLINLNNRLGKEIRYDSLQRRLTKDSENIVQQVEEEQVEEEGVFIPATMSHSHGTVHVFAMDNLAWKKKTLDRESLSATTAIVIETPETTIV